ncbi:putative retrotransposon hot spot (RHS) protein [Trypanosoma cruzi]|uniref:Putative retrotransposon hot spot (RHS) protein n=1 Tax=Trypanosoma cruzi TaxID=5693 RepID=A0A2V2ULG1_TRYCR|nr:putative retrotransposon hot spot (RHS) protein [Trypanosoma cruzi]
MLILTEDKGPCWWSTEFYILNEKKTLKQLTNEPFFPNLFGFHRFSGSGQLPGRLFFLVCFHFLLKCTFFFLYCVMEATLCCHTVWMALLLWLHSHACAYFSFFSFLIGGQCSAFNSIQLRRQGETMPGKRKRVQGGNAESQASAVPQGDGQTRARPESHGVTDQPAATHIRVEGNAAAAVDS